MVFCVHGEASIWYLFCFIFDQVKGLHDSLDTRISALETLKQTEASQPAQATE